jgi:hypothetical protein
MSSSSPARGGRAPSSSSDPQTSPQRGNQPPNDSDDDELGEDLEENMLDDYKAIPELDRYDAAGMDMRCA